MYFKPSVLTMTTGFLFSLSSLTAAPISPKLLWSVTQDLQGPESSYYDEGSQQLFVSNVNGEPLKKDQNGYISIINPKSGQMVKKDFVTGLNAPKGLRSANGVLYVSDIDTVHLIDIKSGKINSSVVCPGAQFLNDIGLAKDGSIYVSDTSQNAIYLIKNGKAEIWLKDAALMAPNGLFVHPPYISVAGWGTGVDANLGTKGPGSLLNVDLTTKKTTTLSTPLGHLDGLELGSKKLGYGYIVSDWVKGSVYLIQKSKVTELLKDLKGSADIGFDQKSNVLFVPEMAANKLSAYQL
jgi:sugar lactone lactonase YvrE